VRRHRERLDQRGLLEAHRGGDAIKDVLRHLHELGERAVLAVVPARDAQHAPVVAQVREPLSREVARGVVDHRVERHALAWLKAGDVAADFLDHAGRLVTHHHRRDAPAGAAVHPVDVAAADAAGLHPHHDVLRPRPRRRHVLDLELPVRLEDEGFHVGSELRPAQAILRPRRWSRLRGRLREGGAAS
jgi:hypothetical protein